MHRRLLPSSVLGTAWSLGLAPLVAIALFAAGSVLALPTGEQVVAGQVSVIRPNQSTLAVQQASPKAIVNWQGFSIGAGEKVGFTQPNASSVILNRVVGGNASAIFGQMSANGRVFLVNPSGVLFGPSSSIDVGGLVASTLNISNEDFLAGRYSFAVSGAPAAVVNQGTLRASTNGSILLLGGQVSNEGTITAQMGTVAMGAGNKISLDFAGDGLTRINVDEAAVGAWVQNRGMIVADGGQAILTAHAAQALTETVVNQQGVIRARSLVERNGRIVLDGGDAGVVLMSGVLDASGGEPGQAGGEIQVLGHHVGITGSALLDASGDAGGGTVLVGGDYQGKNPAVRNAHASWFGPDATIRADALTRGVGGKVIVWSDEATRAYGTISAQGGTQGGDGGLVETSGRFLDVAGLRVNASAPHGKAGEWLLDPIDITIQEAVSSFGVTASPNFISVKPPAVVASSDIEAALNLGTSVSISTGTTLTQAGNITIAGGTTIEKSGGGNATLRLNAHNFIAVSNGVRISSSSGPLNVEFNSDSDANGAGSIVVGVELNSGSDANGAGSIVVGEVEIRTNGGNVRLFGGSDPVNGRAQPVSGFPLGVQLVGTTINTVPLTGGAGGHVVIRGHGGSVIPEAGPMAGDGGVLLEGTVISAGSGNVTIDGIAGAGAAVPSIGTAGAGISLAGGVTVSTDSGTISLTGRGSTPGAGQGDGGAGVRIDGDSTISTSTGSLLINGAGGTGGFGGVGGAGGAGGIGLGMQTGTLSAKAGSVMIVATGGNGGAGPGSEGGPGGSGGVGGAGVLLNDAAITTGGNGSITITGSAGAGGEGGPPIPTGPGGMGGTGVSLTANTIIVADAGSISITGTGAAGGAGGSVGFDEGGQGGAGGTGGTGIELAVASIGSQTGSVTLRGTSGPGGAGGSGSPAGIAGFGAPGVDLGSGAIIMVPGEVPAFIQRPTLTTGSGSINVFGLGQGSPGSPMAVQGIFLASPIISATNGGRIDIRGRADGVSPSQVGVDADDATITTAGAQGSIAITGETTGTGPGLRLNSGTTVGGPGTSGNIFLRALNGGDGDMIQLAGTIQSSGVVNLRPGGVSAAGDLTAAHTVPIELWSDTGGFGLGFTDLTALSDGFAAIVIGSSDHSGPITHHDSRETPWRDNLTLQNGAAGRAGLNIVGSLLNAGNLVTLSSGGTVMQEAPIAASSLLLHGTQAQSNFQLANASNSVGTFASRFEVPRDTSNPVGDVNFVNSGSLTVGSLTGTGIDTPAGTPAPLISTDSSSGGDFFARTLTGDLTLQHGIRTLGSNIVLVSAGVFKNSGRGALLPGGGGTWQVWADTWIGQDPGGLVPSSPQPNFYGCVYPGICSSAVTIPATGNHFIYAQQPQVTVVADNINRFFGQANPSLTFRAVGLINGDTTTDAIAGTLSTPATQFSPVGQYPSAGSFSSPVGYQINFVPGTLTVLDPRPLIESQAQRRSPEDVTSDLYGANIGTSVMCQPTGPLQAQGTTKGADLLSMEWARVREQPNLSNCVGITERSGCDDF